MNEEEIDQLARENFSRRIRAIAMESLLLEKKKVEKKEKEGKEDDDNADDDDDFKDDEKTNNAFMNARKEMARGLGISARAFQSAAEMLSQEDRAVNAAPSQKEEETKNVEENDAPEVDDDERRKRMAMMEEIAKRVCMENEKKVRARERLAVVDTILEVLKDAEGGR
jgi:membrane-bound lytic murein transglycosylase B